MKCGRITFIHTFDDRDADLDFAVPESDPELLERDRDLDLDGDLDLELDFESSLKVRLLLLVDIKIFINNHLE